MLTHRCADPKGACHQMSTDLVTIVGGGIGGLSAALMMARSGTPVRVLEKAPTFGELGAGIQLAPNATRLLAEHDLLDDVLEHAVRPARLVMINAITGEQLSTLDLTDAHQRYGAPYIVMHRSDLLEVLLAHCREHENVSLHENTEVISFTDIGDEVELGCANGFTYRTQLLFGADGLHSGVRSKVIDDEALCSGYTAYRGAVPIETVDRRVAFDDVVVWVGPGLHFVQYPVRGGELYNQVAVFRSEQYARGQAEWGTPDELDRTFAQTCEGVQAALPSIQRDRRWPMFDRLPADTWSTGRISLLGDAAHPMLQYLAQGACQALPDGRTLARLLPPLAPRPTWSTPAVAKALADYQDRRLAQASTVQTTARTWGDMWHVDPGVPMALRDEAFRLRSPHDYRHIDWLYGETV